MLLKKWVALGLAVAVSATNICPAFARIKESSPKGIINISNDRIALFSDSKTAEFAGGDGTEKNPYQIATAEQLVYMHNNLSAHYTLISDIDMSDQVWLPVGQSTPTGSVVPPFKDNNNFEPYEDIFKGTFNGNGYSIFNLTIKCDEIYDIGLFGCANDKSVIENVQLKNVSITVDKINTDYVEQWNNNAVYAMNVGGVVGKSYGIVKRCSVSGDIKVLNCNDAFVGGIAGYANVSDSINYANIYALCNRDSRFTMDAYGHVGGIVGQTTAVYGTLSNNINYGTVKSDCGNFLYCGGISGEYGDINKCINYGSVEGNILYGVGTSSFAYNCNVGGIVGATSGSIRNCVNEGKITAKINGDTGNNVAAGGIVGYNGYYSSGDIYQSFNNSASIQSYYYYEKKPIKYSNAGRVCGCNVSRISDSYSYFGTRVNLSIPTENIGKNQINGETISSVELNKRLGEIFDISFDEPDSSIIGKNGTVVILPSTNTYKQGTVTDISNCLNATLTSHTEDKSKIAWVSSNPDVVEILDTSYIDGINSDSLLCNLNCKDVGTSTITVTTSDGASASCLVTVVLQEAIDRIESMKIEEVYPVKADSIIMEGGTAIRYYRALDMDGKPVTDTTIYYSIKENEDRSSVTDDKGYFDVQINGKSSNKYTLITKNSIGEIRNNDELPDSFNVNVISPRYSNSSAYSASLSGKLGAGIKKEMFSKMEVELSDTSINGELGKTLAIGFDNYGDRTDLNLTLKGFAEGGSNLSLGLKGEFWGDKAPSIKANNEIKAMYGQNRGYSFKLEDFFNKNNPDYYFNGAMAGLVLLDSTKMDTLGHSAIVDVLYEELYKKIGRDLTKSLSLYADQSVNLLAGKHLEIEPGKVFEKLPAKPKVVLANESENEVYKTTGTGPKEILDESQINIDYSVTNKLTRSFFDVGIESNILKNEKLFKDDKAGKIKMEYDILNTFEGNTETNKSISTTYKPRKGEVDEVSLSVEVPDDNFSALNLSTKESNEYKRLEYTLKGKALNEALSNSDDLKRLALFQEAFIKSDRFNDIWKSLNNIDNNVDVSVYSIKNSLIDMPLNISVVDHIELGIGANLKAVYSEEYKLQDAVFNKDHSLITADYEHVNYSNKHSVKDVLDVVGESIFYFMGKSITSLKDAIVDGVKNGLAFAKGTAANWFIRITSFASKDRNIEILSFNDDKENKAKTVGDIYIVEVFDEGDILVKEFIDKPVELKLGYDLSMLSDSSEDGLAIYYWDEALCTYTKIGGTVDKVNKEVTANITKSGQYVLGVDSEPPVIDNINYFDSNLTANIYDRMSGINSNSIELIIDDVKISEGENISKYYNPYTGYFGYPVGETFAEGSHKVVINAKDNSGNNATKEFIYSNNIFEPSVDLGDVDGSGSLTSRDASLVLYYVLNKDSGLITDGKFKAADVDEDGILTANDAAYLLNRIIKGEW